jgi:hypothetical protein
MPSADAPTLIWLEPAAPAKPPTGAPCNGCGLCCAWQPCPLGMLVSRRRHGRCAALRWSAASRRYHCGVLADPAGLWPALPAWAVPGLQRLARRWIAAGIGCDFDADAQPADRSPG